MSVASTPIVEMGFRQSVKAYVAEARAQILATSRVPAFLIPTLAFPIMFYVFFGVIFGGRGMSLAMPTYLLATYGTFGIIGPALFSFGVGLANERASGELRLKQTTPMPAGAIFGGRIFLCLVFALIIVAGLFVISAVAASVELERGQWMGLAGTLLIGTLPFCAMGLAIGAWANSQAAVAIANLVYLPMAFLSGLWVPISVFPEFIQTIAVIFPAYHLAQLALGVIDMDVGGGAATHVLALVGFTVSFVAIAAMGFRRVTR